MLRTARPQGTSEQLDEGRIDLQDLQPGLLGKLEQVGEILKRPITIFSGYRTDAYSEEVGGFRGDPHSRGIAVDANVNGTPIGRVRGAQAALASSGLLSGDRPGFYHGKPDPAHVQLYNIQNTLGSLWTNAGGPPKVANIMAAIALAESGGRVGAVGGPNTDGSYDYGLWQINSSHRSYDASRLTTDPEYNAQAAVAIYKSQGLTAWTTYKTGSYRHYLEGAARHPVEGSQPPIERPGGGDAGGDGGSGQAFDIAWRDYLNPEMHLFSKKGTLWDPFGIVKGASNAIGGTSDFLKWIAWIFHPRNLLRAVEFLIGTSLLMVGIVFSYKDAQRGGGRQFRAGRGRGGALQSVIKTAETVTPQGRALKAATKASKLASAGAGTRRAEMEGAKIKTEKAKATELRTRGGRKPGRVKKRGPIGFA